MASAATCEAGSFHQITAPSAQASAASRNERQSEQICSPNIIERIARTIDSTRIEWKNRAIRCLDQIEDKLVNNPVQEKIDALGLSIKELFAPLRRFNEWLNTNGQGAWYKQFAIFLAKLPFRAARDILQLLYQIVRGLVYFPVHPLRSLLHLAKLTVTLLAKLLEPETWALIGAGMVGSNCGFAAITGTPFPLLGVAIGGALVIAGVSFCGFKAALLAEHGHKWNAVKANLRTTTEKLPEAALSAFLLGLLIGGIMRAFAEGARKPTAELTPMEKKALQFEKEVSDAQKFVGPLNTMEDCKRFIAKLMEKYDLPSPEFVNAGHGNFVLSWKLVNLRGMARDGWLRLHTEYPGLFPRYLNWKLYRVDGIAIEADSSGLVNSETYAIHTSR